MAERSPVFLGLIRSPRLFGLPIFYAMLWIFGTVLALIWSQSLLAFLVSAAVYPALWMAAEWDPNFMEVIRVVSQKTRPTKNRDVWGGDSYAP